MGLAALSRGERACEAAHRLSTQAACVFAAAKPGREPTSVLHNLRVPGSYARYADQRTHRLGCRTPFPVSEYRNCAILFRVAPNPANEMRALCDWRAPVAARLDAIDRPILKELQADGRITNVELASRVGISAPPCLRRVRALEEAGYIKGYRALLDEKLLGYEVTVFAMVHLSSQADADLKQFEDFVRAQPLARECLVLSGALGFILTRDGADPQ